jgi:hypothetical protein
LTSDGHVTISVSTNSAGTFTLDASTCMPAPEPWPVTANNPMHAP